MRPWILGIAVILLPLLSACSIRKEAYPVAGIVERIAPQFADDIVFERMDSPSGRDMFELESLSSGKIVIRGNNSISMAMGFNHYLKYYCMTSVSWFTDQPVQLPEVLPEVPEKIRKEARVPKRFFLNYCTFGYTMPWHRMSIVDQLEGPLPHSYMEHQQELQKKILKRERGLGMTPVLSGFSAHVPQQLSRIYPEAKLSGLGAHLENSYSCFVLDPEDSLFKKIQKAFIVEQTRLFGTDHIYGIDLLNEVKPPSWEPEYLADLSNAIYESMVEADPEGADDHAGLFL